MFRPARCVSFFVLPGLAACAPSPSPVEAPTLSGPARTALAQPGEADAGGGSGTIADASSTPAASRAENDEQPSSDEPALDDVAAVLNALDGGVFFGSGPMTTGLGLRGTGVGGSGSGGLGSSDAGAAAFDASLSAEQIRRVVVAHKGSLRACYELEAQKIASLAGKVVLSWRIDPSGSVSSAGVTSSTMNNAHVEACLVRQVRSWRFPPSKAGAATTFPFAFGTH